MSLRDVRSVLAALMSSDCVRLRSVPAGLEAKKLKGQPQAQRSFSETFLQRSAPQVKRSFSVALLMRSARYAESL